VTTRRVVGKINGLPALTFAPCCDEGRERERFYKVWSPSDAVFFLKATLWIFKENKYEAIGASNKYVSFFYALNLRNLSGLLELGRPPEIYEV
jgi:hypothetical protein